MEQEPFSLLSPEDDKEKKDKRKRRDKFAVPLPLSESEKSKNEKPEKPEPTPLDKAVAELALKKREEAAKQKAEEGEPAKKLEKPEQAEAPATEEEAAIAVAREKLVEARDDATDDTDKDEKSEVYELPPTDLSGGEVIIHLQGDATREERVIPLPAAGEVKAADDEPAAEKPEQPELPPEEPAETPSAETAPEPVAPETAAGGGGEVPPTEPPETGIPTGGAPEPPERPAASTGRGSEFVPPTARGAAAFETVTEPPELSTLPAPIRAAEFASPAEAAVGTPERSDANYATKRELEDAVYTATREGQNRGVLAGLIAGGAYEHFKHKRREKRQAKRMKQQARELDKLQEQQGWQIRQHEREVEQLKHMANGAEVSRQAAPVATAEQMIQPAGQQRFTEGMPFPLSEQRGRFSEQPATPGQNRPIEQMRAQGVEPSSGINEAAPKRDQTEKEQKEKSPAAVPAQTERLEIPPEHRLQSSAWHSIEVDSRTGKPVENPAFEYGHEYYRERSQESAPRHNIDNAAGEAALVADALSSTTDAPGGRDSANQPMLPPSAETHITPQTFAREKAKKAGSSLPGTGPLWPYVVAFVVVVILLIAVLR